MLIVYNLGNISRLPAASSPGDDHVTFWSVFSPLLYTSVVCCVCRYISIHPSTHTTNGDEN